MPLADLEATPGAIRIVSHALASGRVSGSYLLYGPVGAELEPLARGFAKARFCQNVTNDFCDACNVCRRVDLDRFADLIVLRPEEQLIKIDAIRTQIIGPSLTTPHEADCRVFVVTEAERMNHQAANALLKTLEEPPPGVFLLLLTCHRERLLPTIRSRCQPIPVGILGADRVARILERRHGMDRKEAECLARLAGGRLATAEALRLEDNSALEEAALELLALTCEGSLPEALALCESRKMVDRENVLQVLAQWERWLRDGLVASTQAPASLAYHGDGDAAARLRNWFGTTPPGAMTEMLERVWDAMADVRAYVNVHTILSDLVVACARRTRPEPTQG